MRRVAITVAVALTACACGSRTRTADRSAASTTSSAAAGRRGTAATSRVACSHGIAAFDELPDGFDAVLGQVALPTSEVRAKALQTSDRSGGDGPRYFAKTGLVIRKGADAEIAAAPAAEGGLWFEWGTSDTPSAEVFVDGCGQSTATEWTAVAGGYWVDEPGCLPIRVTDAGSHVEDVTIGIGAPCPGQLPTPEPSDG